MWYDTPVFFWESIISLIAFGFVYFLAVTNKRELSLKNFTNDKFAFFVLGSFIFGIWLFYWYL